MRTAHSETQLKAAADVVETTCQDITKLRTDLAGELSALMSQGWHGPASQVYRKKLQDFDSEFGDVLQSLDTFHGKLVDTNIQFSRSESEQVAAVQAIEAVIGAKQA